MNDEKRSREDLIKEIEDLRRRINELEKSAKKRPKRGAGGRGLCAAPVQNPDSAVLARHKGVIEYVDPGSAHIRDHGIEGLVGRGLALPGKDLPAGRSEGRIAGKPGMGEIYWEDASVSALTDAVGNITHFVAVRKDAAEKRNADEALQSRAGRYRALFSDSPIALIEYEYGELNSYIEELRAGGVTDFRKFLEENPSQVQVFASKIKVTDANKAAVELFRAGDRHGLIGEIDGIFTTTSYDAFREALIVVASGGTEYETETTIRPLDGEVRDVFMRLRVVSGGPGEYRAIVATMDTTLRKRAEQELEKSRERLREAEKVARLGYYVFDVRSGRWSSSAILDEIFGIGETYVRDVAGWLRIVHPEFRKDMRAYLETDVLGRRQCFDREYRIINQRTGEPRWVHGLGSLKVDEETVDVLEIFGTVQDVTERKCAEQEARREMGVTKNLLRLSETTFRISDIDELMKNVAGITRDILSADQVMTYIWDSGGRILRPSESSGLVRESEALFRTMPLKLDIPQLRGAMDTGRVFIEALAPESRQLELQKAGLCDWAERAEMIALLPLVGKREYQGLIICLCLGCGGEDYECFSERNRGLMQAVANQVSVALEEARHYKESLITAMELSRKVETIETFSRISRVILSTLDVDAIMELTARMVHRLVPCDWLRIIDIDREREVFVFTAGFADGEPRRSVTTPFEHTSLANILATRRPEYIADLKTYAAAKGLEADLAAEGYRSVLRIPIIVKAEVAGVLGLMSRRVSAFGPADFSTLEDLSYHVGVALANARLVRDLEEFSIGTIAALARSIDAKSPWTHGHSERVTRIALGIGREVGLDSKALRDLRVVGLLHDIGKIGTYEYILDKRGKLTEDEMREIRKHPARGAEILGPIPQMRHLLPVIRGHHECFNGQGYPDGLCGEEIPLQARILSVADTVDAMGADRPYRKGMTRETIIKELKRCSGTQFDPAIVEAYIRWVSKKDAGP